MVGAERWRLRALSKPAKASAVVAEIGSEMAPLAAPRLTAWLTCALSFFTLTTGALPASAAVLISVNKSAQQMSVAVDGVPRYRFAVSTGRAGYGTPSGTYRPQRLAAKLQRSPKPWAGETHLGMWCGIATGLRQRIYPGAFAPWAFATGRLWRVRPGRTDMRRG
jgi:hypothetical protein